MSTCPSCDAQVPDGGQFCPSCGTPTAAPAPQPPAVPEPQQYAAPPTAPPSYSQQYPPSAGVQQVPKKSRKGLIIGIVVVVLVALLGCCGGGAWLVLNSSGDISAADKAKVETVETFAIGLGTLDFNKLRSVTSPDVHDALTAIEEALFVEGVDYGESVLLSSEWTEGTLMMTFEDSAGHVSYIHIYPPTDGGTSLYTMDWDQDSSEAEAVRTNFELIDEDGWKVHSIDGETLDVYLNL